MNNEPLKDTEDENLELNTDKNFELVYKDLKDLVELYRITPEHLRETLATYIKGTVECMKEHAPPYRHVSHKPSDENIKKAEKILKEIDELLPG